MTFVVMVVDDSATVRSQAGRALAAAGFEVIQAVDGVDGLEKLGARTDILLILSDVNMPRMDGLEFVEAIARRAEPMPNVIMLTTEGRPELIKRAKASGAKAWIIKPFKPEALVAAARALVPATA
ncbi:response regulator [soil metagenome]